MIFPLSTIPNGLWPPIHRARGALARGAAETVYPKAAAFPGCQDQRRSSESAPKIDGMVMV